MADESRARARFTFGPLEQRGLVGSLRPAQTAILGAALVLAVLVLASRRDAVGMLAAVAVATVAMLLVFFKVRGRTLEAWAPVIARYVARSLMGRLRYRSAAPAAGLLLRPNGSIDLAVSLPEELGDVELVAAPVDPAGTAAIGVVKDRRGQTFTATLGVRVRNFALLSDAEQERRLAAYGTVLAGLARDDSVIRRVGWVERTVPNDGDDVAAYLQQARDPALALWSGPVSSYIELIESAADVTQEHELFVSLQLDGWRARAQARKLGPAIRGCCAWSSARSSCSPGALRAPEYRCWALYRRGCWPRRSAMAMTHSGAAPAPGQAPLTGRATVPRSSSPDRKPVTRRGRRWPPIQPSMSPTG